MHTLDLFFPERAGRALDLGCGGGRDTRELLKRGWRVDAVDSDAGALEICRGLGQEFPALRVIEANFSSASLEVGAYDLVNASYSLPFCPPDSFPAFWRKVRASLRPGGMISCELFGERDTWATNEGMTFHRRAEVEQLLAGMTVEMLKESEEDRPSFGGPMKHWHLFVVVAINAP